MKIRPSIPAKRLLEIQPNGKLIKKSAGFVLELLEKYFGSEILLDMPEELLDVPSGFIKIITTFSGLESFGGIKNIKINRLPDEPFLYQYSTKINGRIFGQGAHMFDEEGALQKSISEAISRYLWNSSEDFFNKFIVYNSYNKIKKRVLDITKIAGFTQKQKNECPELFFDECTRFGWIKAKSITDKKSVFCPVQLLSESYYLSNVKTESSSQKPEPLLRWNSPIGLSAGNSLEEAIVKGILDVIGRDAFAISYLNKLSLPVIDLDYLASQDSDILNILEILMRYRLKVDLIKFPADFPVKVIVAIISDLTEVGPALTTGISVGFDIKNCIIDAISQGLFIRQILRKKQDETEDKQETEIESLETKKRLHFWAATENKVKMDFLFGKTIKIDLIKDRNLFAVEEDRKKYYSRKLSVLVGKLKKEQYAALYAEITSPDVRSSQLKFVRVIIPELQPLHSAEKIPYLGGERLWNIPLKMGYQPAELFNTDPNPLL